jgi:hypothetical protein
MVNVFAAEFDGAEFGFKSFFCSVVESAANQSDVKD